MRLGRNRGGVRVIAGCWRGRRIPVPVVQGLRPTPDRVRETLFNWLAPVIRGAHCLDLFTGSGALALESLSRGAAGVVAVDRHAAAVRALREVATTFGAESLEVLQADALTFLERQARPFDVVFVDPPFASGLLPEVLTRLNAGWLADPAWVYIESPLEKALTELPQGWQEWRSHCAGDVVFRLARRG